MSGAKERLKRRAEVERHYLLSESPAEICQAVGCSVATVNRDLGVIRERWATKAERDCREVIGETLAEVDHLKNQYQEGYDRSLEQREITVSTRTESVIHTQSVSLRREPGRNSASFLDGVGRCIDRKISLLGLASKVPLADREPPLPQMTTAELDAEIERLRPAFERSGPRFEPGDTLPPGFPMPPDEPDTDEADFTYWRKRSRVATPSP